ncbi:hypothetical protein T12_13311 [Trichinella patagoniensis]|uniref:Uncharacterized protein n=1 Tax=Trichinella patagoniensis TaxID=990121 RepID=A0A0V1AA71_9BILA|nr:hypothetical protein T12_13311 [Trichinella patagoniensis]
MPFGRNDFIKKQLDEIRAIIVVQYAVNRPLQSCHNSCSHRNCSLQNENLESDLITKDYQPLEAVTAGSVLALFHYIPQQLKQNR